MDAPSGSTPTARRPAAKAPGTETALRCRPGGMAAGGGRVGDRSKFRTGTRSRTGLPETVPASPSTARHSPDMTNPSEHAACNAFLGRRSPPKQILLFLRLKAVVPQIVRRFAFPDHRSEGSSKIRPADWDL